MDDDSLQDSAAQEGGRETPADETPDQKRDRKPKKDLKITLKQIFEFGGGVAGILVVWAEMYGEREAGKLILYGLALLLFYLLPCHVIYELLKKKRAFVPLSIWFLLACITSIFIVHNSSHLDKPDAPPVVVLPQSDYIEGTEYTYKRLNEKFPFGYAIFYFGQNKIERNEIRNNGLMDWKIDLDKVIIEPDFTTGTVSWKLPPLSAQTDNSTHSSLNLDITGINIEDFSAAFTTPLETGMGARVGIKIENKPCLYAITLSSNQRMPVFVLGFRIPAPDDIEQQKP